MDGRPIDVPQEMTLDGMGEREREKMFASYIIWKCCCILAHGNDIKSDGNDIRRSNVPDSSCEASIGS